MDNCPDVANADQADTDADGIVTESERDAYLAQWGRGLRDELPVTLDGERVERSFSLERMVESYHDLYLAELRARGAAPRSVVSLPPAES